MEPQGSPAAAKSRSPFARSSGPPPMKPLGVLLVLAVIVAAGGGLLFWRPWEPRTAGQAFERASRNEIRLDESLQGLKAADGADPNRMADLEAKIRRGWGAVMDRWPEMPEAAEAAYRLLQRDLRLAAEPAERLRLIDAFLGEQPDHPRKKELLWLKAEIQRDDLQAPLEAIATLEALADAFPEDPLAPKALLAAARIYESIGEHGAAERAYARVAERFPEAAEADQARLRQAALLEERLERRREAAEIYRQVAASNPGSATGQMAQRRRRRLLGELQETDQQAYQRETYRLPEASLYAFSKEEFNSPALERIRNQGLDLTRVDIALRIDPASGEAEVRAVLTGHLERPLTDPLLLQLNPAFEVSRVEWVGADPPVELRHEQRGPYIECLLPESVAAGSSIVLRLTYNGRAGDWFGDRFTEAGGSLRPRALWHPMTHLGDFFSHELTAEVPEAYRAFAQGAEAAASETASLEPGWRRHPYRQARPTQGAALAVTLGAAAIRSGAGPGGVPIAVALSPEHAAQAEACEAALGQAIETMTQLLGPFPFEGLTLVEVPTLEETYAAPGLILVGPGLVAEPEIPAPTIAHAVAHQWFGGALGVDLSADSIPWLVESLAVYLDLLHTQRTEGDKAFLYRLQSLHLLAQQGAEALGEPPLVEVRWQSPAQETALRHRGPLVLHALRREMGDAPFFSMLRALAERTTPLLDVPAFVAAATEAAGRPMDWFFEQELERPGHARVEFQTVEIGEGADGGWDLRLELKQEEPARRMTLDVEFELLDQTRPRGVLDLAGPTATQAFTFGQRPVRVRLDPDFWRLLDRGEELTEKIVYDP